MDAIQFILILLLGFTLGRYTSSGTTLTIVGVDGERKDVYLDAGKSYQTSVKTFVSTEEIK